MQYKGYHGTNQANVSNILINGFKPSAGKKEWYGRGIYFFIDGINSISVDHLAEQWAKDQAFDKKEKTLNYSRFAVIEAIITTNDDSTIDFRDDATQKRVNNVRDFVKKLCHTSKVQFSDDEVWEYMKQKFGIKAVITNSYIKFGEDRRKRISSRINNCTFISVFNDDLIDKDSIKLIREGDI